MNRATRSHAELDALIAHLAFEIHMCANAAARHIQGVGDKIDHVVYLEVALTHARNLHEFLVAPKKQPRIDDVLLSDFVGGDWHLADQPAHVREAAERLSRAMRDTNKQMAHMTWERVDGAAGEIAWECEDVAHDAITVADAWGRHLHTTGVPHFGELLRVRAAVALGVLDDAVRQRANDADR